MSVDRAIAEIDIDGIVRTTAELVAFPSVGPEERGIQLAVAGLMEASGMEVDRWTIDMDTLRRHPAYSAEVERHEPLGVAGHVGGSDGRTLVLNAHVDVVPAGDEDRWTYPPYHATRDGDRLYGRGTCDMKGSLACAIHAVRAIRDAGIQLNGRVILQSVVGEEDGGMGTLAAILRGHVGDAAIVMEPTELMVAPSQGGALGFELTVPGRAAHGALRSEGVSPFDRYLPVYQALREFERERNVQNQDPMFAAYDIPFALCIGRIQSGIWPSTEAESLTAEGRLGVAPGEDPADVRRQFEAVVSAAAQKDDFLRNHPPNVTWSGAQFHPAATPPNAVIVQTVAAAHEASTGVKAVVQGMTYGADMRHFVHEAGMPTVMYGPGDIRRAHAPDEFVPISELKTCTETLVRTIIAWSGVHV